MICKISVSMRAWRKILDLLIKACRELKALKLAICGSWMVSHLVFLDLVVVLSTILKEMKRESLRFKSLKDLSSQDF